MMNTGASWAHRPAGITGFLLFIISSQFALAHHPLQAKFDPASSITLSGQVTEVDWANPHVHIFIRTGQAGEFPTWVVELPSRVDLEASGWRPDTVTPGETINVTGITAKDGSMQAWGESVTTSEGNTVFTVDGQNLQSRLGNRPAGPTPRWPDGQPRLGPAPGETGYWTAPGLSSLVEDGVEVAMDSHGLLENIDDASRVAPFQAWAGDLYRLRQASFLKDDPMYLYCIPPGGPRQFQIPYGVQFLEQRERERIFVLMGAGNSNWRLIYTDDRQQQGQVSGDDDNPLFYGRSVAAWEGDTLVINSTGFNEGFWFSNGGLPHTGLLELEERITRPDLNTLQYQVTVNDPGAYTRPWTSSWTLQWMPDEEMPEYYCQDNKL